MADEPYEGAITLAQKVLGRVNADPDGDIAILARQFLRCAERSTKLTAELAASREVANALGEEAARAVIALTNARAECAAHKHHAAGEYTRGLEHAAKVADMEYATLTIKATGTMTSTGAARVDAAKGTAKGIAAAIRALAGER